MRISFGTIRVDFLSYSSKAELEKKLQDFDGPLDMVDTAGAHARLFYALEFRQEFADSELEPHAVGMCCSRTGIEPQLLLNPSTNLIYVGIDSSLFIFSSLRAPAKRLDLGSPFYWMSWFGKLDRILVVHEIGLLWLDTGGEIVWRHDASDIISSVALRGTNIIELRLSEGGTNTIDLMTGRALSQTPK